MATTDSGSVDSGSVASGSADRGPGDGDLVAATGTLVRPDPRRRSLPPLATGTYEVPEPGEGPSRPRRLLGYAVPTLVVAALAGRWYAGDAVPPLVVDNLRTELWSTWSHQLSGAGSTSYPMARALDTGVSALGGSLDLTGSATAALLTAVCAAYAAATTVWLARGLVRPVAASFAGLLAVVNPVVLLTLPSRTPLVAIGVVSSIAALFHGAVRPPAAAEPAPEAGNPLPVPGAGAGSGRGRPTPLAVALVALPSSLLATEPLLLVGLALAAPAVALAFAVVEGRASVGRFLRFAAWALPLGLAASLWWLVPAVLTWSPGREGVGLQLGGLATPHLAALVVPLGALAAAAVVDRRLERSDVLRRTGYRRWRVLRADALTALGAVALLAVPVPLWTGAVGEGSTAGADESWHEVAATVDAPGALAGKALVLPLTDDDLPRQLLRRPVLQRPGDPLFRLPAAVDAELRRAERLAATGDARGLAAVLDDLAVSHLVVRTDADGAGRVTATAARLRGWRPAGRFGVADVVERVRPAPLLDAVAAEPDGSPPRLAWARHDAGHYEVDVDTAPGGGPFVLRLAETYGAGWAVQGLPPTWSARHGLVAGYANGWRIEGEGTATLHLRHQPSQWSTYAALLSLAAVAIAALASLVPVLRRIGDTPGDTPGIARTP